MPMTSLAPRPGPAAIQRANSLQASDTSHTSASTTDASTSNTSASTSPIKPSPVSSIGESIGCSPVIPTPVCTIPLRTTRPLPIPPTASPALTSTSTLKLSHQESQSTLGKSSLKPSASQSQAAQRRDRSRPPPSSYVPHQGDDDRWVSISVLPALAEGTDIGERQANTGPRVTKHKRSASAGPKLANYPPVNSTDIKAAFPKHTTRITPTPKALPELPSDSQPVTIRQNETSWKLEFRGVVKLVRWVSRRDKRVDSGVDDERSGMLDEKDPGLETKGYSVASLDRKSRGSSTKPRPIPGAEGTLSRPRPISLARPPSKLESTGGKDDEGKEPNKRRLTKSNPIMFGRSSNELKKQPSIELKKEALKTGLPKRSGRRSSSDAARKMLSGSTLNIGRQSGVEGTSRPGVDASLGMALNGGGVFVPESSLSVSSNSALASFVPPVEPVTGPGPSVPGSGSALVSTTSYSPPYLRNPAPVGVAPALLTQTTTTVTQTTTTTTLASPSGFTSTPFAFTSYPSVSTTTTTVLTPVLEGQLFSSPPLIEASEFPWTTVSVGTAESVVGVAVSGGFSPIEGNAISSVTGVGGASPVISSIDASTGNISSMTSSAVSPLMSSASPLLSDSTSPLMSSTTSPLISNRPSPVMSNVTSLPMSSTTSPILLSNSQLCEGANAIPQHMASLGATVTGSSLNYATAPSNGVSVSARIEPAVLARYGAASDLGHDHRLSESDARFGASTELPRFSAAATDLGHGTSTRATSPAPSDRYAFSDDVHEYRPSGGILRALSSADHSDAPLPMPRRPFMTARESNGSGVTFEDSSAQSSPRIGARRKMMTMSSSEIGHGQRTGATRHQVQRSSSSLSIAGRIIRTLSIGSNKASHDSEAEGPRTTRKLIRKKMYSRTGSVISLVIPDGSVPPVPPLPPGVVSGPYASEHGHGDGSALGHGDSVLGHGDSAIGHGQYTNVFGSSSVLGHGDPSAISPAPTRNSFATTQSAPTTMSGTRKLRKRQPSKSRHSEVFGRTLASINLNNDDASRHPPMITTQFAQVSLMGGEELLTASVCGTTDDGHLMVPIRPGLPRRTSSQRRWTIADIDDEEFLRQLEVKLSGVGGRMRQSRMLEDFAMGVDGDVIDLGPEDEQHSHSDDSLAEREWARARRAMMCVREIVRTEKSYMRHLNGFLNSEDSTGVSPILAEHLPRLIETSRMFCARLEEDPSAKGVSNAFLAVEEVLDFVFVQWSGVVGEVISSTQQRTESQATSEDGHTSSAGAGSGSSWIRRRSATASSAIQPSFLSMTPVNGGNSKNKKSARGSKPKKMTEQDVVIMPTQRAIRYVLMYRELLLHTPVTSASRPLVERALQGATRIARRCDEAQNHVDHILSPSSQ